MTFSAREESRALGAPIYLYLFRFGEEEDAFAAYTDHEDQVTHNGIVYTPTSISHGGITASAGDKNSLDIVAARDIPLASRFLGVPPSSVTAATIFAGHVGESQFIRIWGGRMLGVTWKDGTEVQFSCESRAVALRRGGLNRKYGPGCPHLLYGPDCRASKVATTVTKTVVSFSGTTLTFAADWANSTNRPKYKGGIAEWLSVEGFTERRSIVAVGDGDGTVTLNAYPSGLANGATVSLSWGCDHEMTGCAIHNNLPNYGGQPWIPLENPIGFRNMFA